MAKKPINPKLERINAEYKLKYKPFMWPMILAVLLIIGGSIVSVFALFEWKLLILGIGMVIIGFVWIFKINKKQKPIREEHLAKIKKDKDVYISALELQVKQLRTILIIAVVIWYFYYYL